MFPESLATNDRGETSNGTAQLIDIGELQRVHRRGLVPLARIWSLLPWDGLNVSESKWTATNGRRNQETMRVFRRISSMFRKLCPKMYDRASGQTIRVVFIWCHASFARLLQPKQWLPFELHQKCPMLSRCPNETPALMSDWLTSGFWINPQDKHIDTINYSLLVSTIKVVI